MNYLLDTHICIHFLKGEFGLNEKFKAIGFSEFAISEITLAELMYSSENSNNANHNRQVVDDFADRIIILPIFDAITVYSKEKSRLKANGIFVSDCNLFIGATAIVNNLVLVTRNILEYQSIENIELENWIDNH